MSNELPPVGDAWWDEAGTMMLEELRKGPLTIDEAKNKAYRPFGCRLPPAEIAVALLAYLKEKGQVQFVRRKKDYGPAVWCIPGTGIEGAIPEGGAGGGGGGVLAIVTNKVTFNVAQARRDFEGVSRQLKARRVEGIARAVVDAVNQSPAPGAARLDVTTPEDQVKDDADWLTPQDGAKLLGTGIARLRQLGSEGRIKRREIGGGEERKLWEYSRADIEKYLKDREAVPQGIRAGAKPGGEKPKRKLVKPAATTMQQVVEKHTRSKALIVARAVPADVSLKDRILWCVQGARIGQMTDQEALERIAATLEQQ